MTSATTTRMQGRAFAIAALLRVMPVLTLVLLVAGTAFMVATWDWDEPLGERFGFRGFQIVIAGMFAAVGAVIVAQRPAHIVGRLLSAMGLIAALDMYLQFYSIYSVLQSPGVLPGGRIAAWMQNWLWIWLTTLGGQILFLLFPSGRLQSPRWRIGVVLALLAAVAFTISLSFTPGPLDSSPRIDNPFGLESYETWLDVTLVVGIVLLVVSSAIAIVSLVLRMRHSHGAERLQLKWISFASAMLTVGFATFPLAEALGTPAAEKAVHIIIILGLMGVPLAVGFAVLRYRLYEIDRIINRTLVYGALTASLALTYLGLVLSLGSLLRSTAGESSSLVVAASTIAVAALFQPLRVRIQRLVDRRFFRRKYDATTTAEAFNSRIQNAVDLDSLRADLRHVIEDTVQPSHVSLWLRGTPGDR